MRRHVTGAGYSGFDVGRVSKSALNCFLRAVSWRISPVQPEVVFVGLPARCPTGWAAQQKHMQRPPYIHIHPHPMIDIQ